MKPHFAKLDHAPAYKVLSEAIACEILEGRIRPGEQLPTEHGLAEQFGVNRSTVREGIRLLEETGLISREGGKRLVVAIPSYDALANHMGRAMVMHEVTFRELWEATMAIEPPTAALAARNLEAEIAEQLRNNLIRTEVALSEGRSVVMLDIEFHALVARAASNRALLMAREPLGLLFYPAFEAILSTVSTAGKRLLTAHKAIFDSLNAGDADKAQEWMEKHIVDFKRGYKAAGLDMDQPIRSSSASIAVVRDRHRSETE